MSQITQEYLKSILHYNPETGILTRLSNGKIAGSLKQTGYISLKIDNVDHSAHKIIWIYLNGDFPTGKITHVNGIKHDNRQDNLSIKIDHKYTDAKPVDNPIPGISWDKKNKVYRVSISINCELITLGRFINYKDAVDARLNAEVKYGFNTHKVNPESKSCVTCSKEKSINEFAFRNDSSTYRHSCKECVLSKSRHHYVKIKDHKLRLGREWYENNKQTRNETIKLWKDKNRVKVSSYWVNRRCRERNAKGTFNGDQITKLLKDQKCKCVYCKKDITNSYHIDHIVPLARNGKNSIDNLQLLCPRCNCSKGAKRPEDFAQQFGMLI